MPAPLPPSKKKPASPRRLPQDWRFTAGYVVLMLLLLWLWQDHWHAPTVRNIPYSEFKKAVAAGQVIECQIMEETITGRIDPTRRKNSPRIDESAASKVVAPPGNKSSDKIQAKKDKGKDKGKAGGKEVFHFRTDKVNEDSKLVDELDARGVRYEAVRPNLLTQFFLGWVLPIGFMVGLWMFLSRRIGMAGQAVMNIGKSKAKLVADRDTGVTFVDVAGCDEAKAELEEVVDYLKNPERYKALGAAIPKGVLLVGPPGTGKTLLARAVAGEAHVPFFSLSGSDFVEMFVGVGAARVRDLFEQAKQNAPCIVFIDELDAIGRERGVHVGAVNDEREQTLNQLLVEMDGFEPNTGVILLAATNRPEVLDRALLRPGRFDRQVVVDSPDIDGREAILKVHTRKKPLSDNVNLRRIAQATPGFSGADLANAMNEAALLAARRGAGSITQRDLEDAIEKVIAGPERRSRRLEEDEKRRVAYHEVGHALVAAFSEHADPVHKISIVPRGRAALGYTMQLPEGQQFLMTRSELIDRIKGMLGGRGAEEVIFGEISTGAENDLERATALARQMVCLYGMSESVGLVHCGQTRPMYLPNMDGAIQADCSDETARAIDHEVKSLLDQCYRDAKKILNERRTELDRIAQELLQVETLDADAFKRLLANNTGAAVPEPVTHN